jgi:transcriptional regulator with XRE-family HTH domain
MVLAELRTARRDRGLDGADIARQIGMSQSHYSRIERGRTGSLSIELAAALLAAVGLDLSIRSYPGGEPLRDAAHVGLLRRFTAEVHRSLRVLTEVAFPQPGDRRAWDVVVLGRDWRHGVEAETRPRDRQALERRLALKMRDGDVSSMSLLLLDSRYNRDFVRANEDVLRDRFPLPGRRALEALRDGLDPGGSSIILL